MSLTAKQKLFCHEYVSNGYKLQLAYLTAFPNASPGTANANSWKLMKDQAIKDYIKEIQHDRFEALNINADRIAEELSQMAFGEVDEHSRLGYTDKTKALELLGKQLGLYTQKMDINTDNNFNITILEEDELNG